jgi:predicted alpha/beta superfamily hydrolase
MKYTILILVGLAGVKLFGQIPSVSSGKIVRLESFPSDYVNPRNVDVWLPANYDTGGAYAVLYMHDGQMLFDATKTWNGQEWKVDETVSRLLQEGRIRDCIVVGIWNDGEYRRSDYLPQKALGYLPDELSDSITRTMLMGAPRGDAYLKFLVTELKPFIDTRFSTRTDRNNTFIMGSSMGGLISMYAICEYPEVFGGAACLSTHWFGAPLSWNKRVPEAYIKYLAEHLPDPAHHRLYFDYGTETLDKHYAPYQARADEVIRSAGYDDSHFMNRKYTGDAHTEAAWAGRLKVPVVFLLGRK